MDKSMDTSTPPTVNLPADSTTSPPEDGTQAQGAPTPTSFQPPSPLKPVAPPVRESFPKRGLPDSLSSSQPHGLITGESRSADQQAALEARKAEILSTMTAEQIEEAYQDTAKKIHDVLQEIKDDNEKIDKELEDAKKTREMERRAWLGLKKAAAEGEI